MSAPGSRLAWQMRPHLGAALWGEFVAHANWHYKARWLRAFAPTSGVLRCVGALDGAVRARGAGRSEGGGWDGGWEGGVRGRCGARAAAPGPRAAAACDVPPRWRAALRAAPRSWGDGLDGAALCRVLFGVRASAAHGAACVRFRCGPPRDVEGVVLRSVDNAYCHRS